MQIYFAIALTIAALVGWGMGVRAGTSAPRSQILLYNLASLAAAWLVALLTPANDNLFYKGAVVLGMLLALLAVALRASQFLPSYAAHAHLVLTYILYAYAFSSQTSGWPTPFVILLLAIGGAIYYWLYPNLIELWSSVVGYALFIFLATWQALELLVQQPSAWMGRAALAGMLLITVAIVLEAQARFRPFRPAWATASLPVFVLAQLAIAWSVWG
jgi:uncharacterized membrane protein YhhN